MLLDLHGYTHSIEWGDYSEARTTLETHFAYKLPDQGIAVFNSNISTKNIMHQRWPEEISVSKNVVDLKLFVKSLAFENVYADIYATAKATSRYLDDNIQLMQKIAHPIEDNHPVAVISKSR